MYLSHDANFLSYLMSDFYKKEICMESFIHEVCEHSDSFDIKIRFYSSKCDVCNPKFIEFKHKINYKWIDVLNGGQF